MKKAKKILLVSFLAVIFSSVSAFAFNNVEKKSTESGNKIDKSLNYQNDTKFNLCSSCSGCNGNCIINKK